MLVPMDRVKGRVQFQNVSFAYPSVPDKSILAGVSLSADPGQVVALVGATGAGKSTIASLLLRFYDVTGGPCSADGVDLRQVRFWRICAGSWRSFRRSWCCSFARFADNIAYGRPDATDDEIRRCGQGGQRRRIYPAPVQGLRYGGGGAR